MAVHLHDRHSVDRVAHAYEVVGRHLVQGAPHASCIPLVDATSTSYFMAPHSAMAWRVAVATDIKVGTP